MKSGSSVSPNPLWLVGYFKAFLIRGDDALGMAHKRAVDGEKPLPVFNGFDHGFRLIVSSSRMLPKCSTLLTSRAREGFTNIEARAQPIQFAFP